MAMVVAFRAAVNEAALVEGGMEGFFNFIVASNSRLGALKGHWE